MATLFGTNMTTTSNLKRTSNFTFDDRLPLVRRPDARCPCCGAVVATLPRRLSIDSCATCKRPLTLLRMAGRQRLYRLCNVIDLIGAIYGIATSILIMTLIVFDMDAKTFAKAVTILLFVVGSLLAVDGTLSYRTGIDRTWNVTRRGSVATLIGVCKIVSAAFGLCLVAIGVGL
jgi:hypothetical protein